MTDILKPETETQLLEAVRWALSAENPLAISGGGSKSALGRPVETDHALTLAALTGVTLYEPDELVLRASSGTPLSEITALLNEQGQEFAFEPMDYGPLLNLEGERGTIGGLVATNLSGCRRIRAGAARDHVLGFSAVTGRGDVIKSGGRVMKNVTGYDLSKLITGSWGTLAILSEVTLKVLPKAESESTLLLHGLDDAEALSKLTRATATPLEGSSFAHLPDSACFDDLQGPVTAIRFEGPGSSVAQRIEGMKTDLAFTGDISSLPHPKSKAFWQALRDVRPLTGMSDNVWRLSVAPGSGSGVVAALKQAGLSVSAHYYDWAGGLIWLAVPPEATASATAIHRVVDAVGGHATLVRADANSRADAPAFHPEPAPLAALTRRVKESFDPKFILNPGRMWEGV